MLKSPSLGGYTYKERLVLFFLRPNAPCFYFPPRLVYLIKHLVLLVKRRSFEGEKM